MDAIIRFLQDTGFYLFSQDGNWRCLVMIGIACVLLYLGIVKKYEPLLMVPIAFGMLITNLPGAKVEGEQGSFLTDERSSVMYFVCYAAFLLRFTMICELSAAPIKV